MHSLIPTPRWRRNSASRHYVAFFYWGAAAAVFLVAAAGCATTRNKESADREVYALLNQLIPAVPGANPEFSIEYLEATFADCPVLSGEQLDEFLGEYGAVDAGAYVLSLEKALETAVQNSREYQTQKEALYLRALRFTEVRQRYRPVFDGSAGAALAVSTIDEASASRATQAANLARDLASLTSTYGDLLDSYADVVDAAAALSGADAPRVDIDQDRQLGANTSLGVDMLMRGGAQIALTLTSNFLRFLTGDAASVTRSALAAGITQPILGEGRQTARENLLQAERDLLYALRAFTRFRQQFSVTIASAYYRVLQARDEVRNNWLGYRAFQSNLELDRARAETGRITRTELGRTEEGELQARNNWIDAVQAYADALDRFKVQLGLSTDARVVLDPGELERLLARGLLPPPEFAVDDAVKIAFASRLDYYTEVDRTLDAGRRLDIAAEGLLPEISLLLDASVNTSVGEGPLDFDFDRYDWSAGLSLDPKLNRKSVRNRYRERLIEFDASRRNLTGFEDTMKLDVREAWRALEQARISFEIQQNSLKVSERRVLEQELLREIGKGNAIDRVDAQNALIRARNSLSNALVNHTIANLQLWRDMGILYIKEDGQWQEITDVPSEN